MVNGKMVGKLCLMLALLPASSLRGQADADYQQALESFRAGKYFEALVITRRLVGEDPQRPEFHHLHGLTLGALRQFSDAIVELEEAVRLSPEESGYYQDLGMTYLQIDQAPKALEALQKAVRLDPSNLLARLYLGRLLHNSNLSEDALEQFQAIEKQDDRFPTLHFHKSRVLLSLGDGEGAIAELKKEIGNYPDNPLPRLELADLLIKSGDVAGARVQIEQIETLAAKDAESQPARFYFLKAKILQSEQRLEESIAAARKSIDVDPTFAQGYYLLGTLLRQKGDLEGARQVFAQFERLSRQPD